MAALSPLLAGISIPPPDPEYRPPEKPAAECPRCDDRGYILVHSQNIAYRCSCAVKRHQEMRRQDLLEYSNLKQLSRHCFDQLDPQGPYHRPAYSIAFNEAKQYDGATKPLLIFAGPAGSGKTALAAAIGNSAIEQGRVVLWHHAGQLLNQLRGELRNEPMPPPDNREASRCQNADLLIIDDLPAQTATAWEKEQLLVILKNRRDRNQPTILTLRASPETTDPELISQSRDQIIQLPAPQPPSTIPDAMRRSMSFPSFRPAGADPDAPQPTLEAASSALQNWAAQPQGWILLTGPCGVGKTHLAVAVAAQRENLGDLVYYANAIDLFSDLRTSPEPAENARRADLLVIDDLGSERDTPRTAEQILHILQYRYDRRLPTIITTNHSLQQITQRHPRLASRIKDRAVTIIIPMSAPDYRSA